jgi:hypothetical protein
MKVIHPRIPTFLFALGIIFLIFSCEKTEDLLPQQDVAVLNEEVQVNAAFEETDMMTLSAMQSNGLGMRTQLALENDFCSTTKVDFYPNNKSIVINFGDGCTSPKGVTRKGKIMIYFSAMSYDEGTEITMSFDGYEVNGLKIEGRRKIIHRGFFPEGNYFAFETLVVEGKVTWPDGTFATLNAEHIKKLYLPTDSRGFKLEVTGGGGGVTRLGVPFMSLVEDKLVFNQACTEKGNWVPSSGIVHLTVNTDSKFVIDYGMGECDKSATVTHNGKTVSVEFD